MKPLLKQTIKKLTKKIAWILILSILANATGLLFPTTWLEPEKVKAVDASDHMILFWPSNSTCTSPAVPTGWTAISDGVGEAFYQRFPRGAANYAAAAGGSSTHTHAITSIITTAGTTGGDRNSGADITGASPTHTHTNNTASVNSPTVLPKYGEMCVIQNNNGIPTGSSAIPNGAVAIFDATPPAGWTPYSSTFSPASDTFIRGGTNTTGGSNSHGGVGHSITSIILGNNVVGSIQGQGSTKSNSSMTHTHTVPNQTTGTPDVQPPYMNIYIGQKSGTGPIPNGMIAMFDDTDSSVGFSVAGWTRLSDASGPFDGKFLKVTGSYGTPGGNTTHTHAVLNPVSSTGGDDVSLGKAGTGGPIMDHAHNAAITLAVGTNTNIPPYTNVVIAKKQTVITTLSTDKGSYPTLGETISVSTTVNNYHASTALNNKNIDAVIFIDANASGKPDAGETYITNGCAGSAVWASGNYTHQNTAVSAAAGGSASDNWACSNANFPSNTTYTLWARWWDGLSYAYNIYSERSVTFSSIPTLGQILFIALIGIAVYFGYRQGVIKLRPKKKELGDSDKDIDKKDQEKSLLGRDKENINQDES